jgi:riboflavin synthase
VTEKIRHDGNASGTLRNGMFTGIVTHVGQVVRATRRGPDLALRIAAPALARGGLTHGESIAVAGVCLTVTEHDVGGFDADVSAETLRCTTLGRAAPDMRVNLERALSLGERLGGHLVTGHVDGLARVVTVEPEGECVRVTLEVPAPLARYVARKGSVALDGVSLTVNNVHGQRFGVNLIPATLARTTLASLAPGTELNFEVDLVARYLERLGTAPAQEP